MILVPKRKAVGVFNIGSGSRALPSSFRSFLQGGVGAGCGFSFSTMQKATPIHYVPACGGDASSFLDFEQRVMLRNGSTDVPAERRATLLILRMDATARQACWRSGGDSLRGGDSSSAGLFPTGCNWSRFQAGGQVYDAQKD